MIEYHWNELKYRFYYWCFSFILTCLIIWYLKFNILFAITDLNLIFTSLTEAFEQYIYFTILLSFILNIPLFIFHYFLFLLPGLYLFELKNFLKKLIKYSLIFVLFYYLIFYYVFDNIINFFTEFESEYLYLNLKIKDFLSFINSFILGFLLIFFLPFIKLELNNKRKFIYLSIMIIIAFITPPDLFSLIISIIPLFILLELNYFLELLKEKKRKEKKKG